MECLPSADLKKAAQSLWDSSKELQLYKHEKFMLEQFLSSDSEANRAKTDEAAERLELVAAQVNILSRKEEDATTALTACSDEERKRLDEA